MVFKLYALLTNLLFCVAFHHWDDPLLQKARLGLCNWIDHDHHVGDVHNVPKHFSVPPANCISEVHRCLAHFLSDGSILCFCGSSFLENGDI